MNTIKRYKLSHSINTPLNVCITVENDFVLAAEYDKLVAKNAALEGCLAKLSCAYESRMDAVAEEVLQAERIVRHNQAIEIAKLRKQVDLLMAKGETK